MFKVYKKVIYKKHIGMAEEMEKKTQLICSRRYW